MICITSIMKKIVSTAICLAAAAALAALVCGCSSASDGEQTETENVPAVPEGASCTIVRSDTSSDAVTQAAVELRRRLTELGVKADLTTDWVKRGEPIVRFPNEILIGPTNRPESEELYGRLTDQNDPCDYLITVGKENCIAAREENITEAALLFADEYVKRISDGTDSEVYEMKRTHIFDRKLLINGNSYTMAEISSGKTGPELYAASELKNYLYKIGVWEGEGAKFDVEIDDSLDRDGYAIDIKDDKTISVRGGNGRGVIYGVYAFLEHYAGVRFFMPGVETLGTGDVSVSESFAHTPIFEMRQSDWQCGNGSEDWCLKNGINQREISESHGGNIKYGGFVHTMASLADIPADSQPCFSDPEILAKTIESVRAMLENDPTITIVSVSQNDNQNYCRCDKCRAVDAEEGSHMGSLLRFVNAVAQDIEKDYPDVIIDTLAYQHTRTAPKITKPRSNVCIRLCSIECCFSHPLEDESCAVNAAFHKDIVEWSRICDRIYVWDYVTCFSYYVPTFPNFGVLRRNMRFFAEHGVKGMYPEGNYNSPQSGEFGELRCYLLAKLMMDPMMSEEEYYSLMDEFLEAYYGEGWRGIRRYIDWTTEEAAKSHMNIWNPPFNYIPRSKYAEMEETFDGYWNEAEKLAGDRIDAVKRSRIQWSCIKLMIHPDEDGGRQLRDDLVDFSIRWNEWKELPNERILDLSPAEWN